MRLLQGHRFSINGLVLGGHRVLVGVVDTVTQFSFTDNGNGTFTLTSVGTAPNITLEDNGDGTFTRTS